MSLLQVLLLFGVVVLMVLLAYGFFELITCCLQPGLVRSIFSSGDDSPIRRKRLLSIYDIYNSATAKNDIVTVKDPKLNSNTCVITVRPPKRGSFSRTLPSVPTIPENIEELDQPPSYAHVTTGSQTSSGVILTPCTMVDAVRIV